MPDLCIASSNLLSVVDPLLLDWLSRHTVAAIRSWPTTDHRHILAVASRDIRVSRQNLAELQLYVDDHATHIANCAAADDDDIPLMSAETFPRLEGGVRAALEEVDRGWTLDFYDRALKVMNCVCVCARSVSISADGEYQTCICLIALYKTPGLFYSEN